MTRSAEKEADYQKYLKKLDRSVCQFCKLPRKQIAERYKLFLVIRNIFGYEIWDSSKVAEHLMILPKRHITTKSDFTDEEKAEFMDIITDYEGKGYNLYSRGHNSHMKSVLHQHSHLIKLQDNSRVNYFFFNQNPYSQVYG